MTPVSQLRSQFKPGYVHLPKHTINRRPFVYLTALAAASLAAAGPTTIPDEGKAGGFCIGCQAYTVKGFSVVEQIETTARVGGKTSQEFAGNISLEYEARDQANTMKEVAQCTEFVRRSSESLTDKAPGASQRSARNVTLAMLNNIKENGFNPDPRINGGLGGLWINWRYGTRPLQVNFNGSGAPDGAKVDPPRHDDLTDLRYLHNLLSWRHLNPADSQFDAEIKRFTGIVKREFAGTHNERGWMYDELMDMWRLSGDGFFRETARTLAEYYATKEVHADIGAVYKTRANKPRGYYRVDLALEMGCALVMAGVEFKQPDWSRRGERLVNFVYDHAYLREYHLFLNQMDEVRLPDGSANPNQKIYREPFRNYVADGGVVRFGSVGQIALSLLHANVVTTNSLYLDRANDLLMPLTAERNTLGLWDDQHGGYFNGVQFDGPDFLHPGKPKLLKTKKETGRQFHMLQAFHVANQLTGGKYQAMEAAMLRVLLEKAYYSPGQGIFYEAQPDWSPLRLKNKQNGLEDWVTTEAMGCAMMALFSLQEKLPW